VNIEYLRMSNGGDVSFELGMGMRSSCRNKLERRS
jgi:hypothetical protein